MNFVIYFTLPAFFRTLKTGCTVFICPYSESKKGLVLLTSDGGQENGTIRAVQIVVTTRDEEKSVLDLAVESGERIEGFLNKKGVLTREGILLTAGLHEVLRYWGQATEYDPAELDELIEGGKDATLE